MTDCYHLYGNDLALSATGDLLLADGDDESKQRVLRRLLTNPTQYDTSGKVTATGDYLWQPEYGAGLPTYIGAVLDEQELGALIEAQMYLEDSVVQDPPPQVGLRTIPDGVSAQILYNTATVLNFSVTP